LYIEYLRTTGAVDSTKRPWTAKLKDLAYGEAVEEIYDLTRPKEWMREEEGPSWELVEREVALAIYRQEPGTENKVCPSLWRDSFVAGDEMRDRFLSVPDEALVEMVKGIRTLESLREEAGISEELVNRALGPDHEEIPEEEQVRRIIEYMADAFFGEKAYRVHKLVLKL